MAVEAVLGRGRTSDGAVVSAFLRRPGGRTRARYRTAATVRSALRGGSPVTDQAPRDVGTSMRVPYAQTVHGEEGIPACPHFRRPSTQPGHHGHTFARRVSR